uniref:BTB domain-containing protein n=1 Tax=Panagrolaimus sp. ES5 TaxID=591445 RepID=A0AC34FTB4_9BILA
MFYKIDIVKKAELSPHYHTVIKFAKNQKFTCSKFNPITSGYRIKDAKGDFVITRIARVFSDGFIRDIERDKSSNTFQSVPDRYRHIFYITANIEMKEMTEKMRIVTYQLQIPLCRLQTLEPYHFFKSEFVLSGYDGLKFTYSVMKINDDKADDIEICIENPYDVEIHGEEGDFKFRESSTVDITKGLSFCFDPAICDQSAQEQKCDPIPHLDKSMLSSVVPSPSNSNAKTILHKLASNHHFADVLFITSDGTKIPSHRCILAQYSTIFARVFEETSETPVKINVEDFAADTIQSALDFIYDKTDAIKGKEMEVFKFAVKYDVKLLIEACCSFFEESVVPENVCEYIEIAYDNNFEELKQKCLKILVEKKKEIDASKIAALPKNIVVDAFCL